MLWILVVHLGNNECNCRKLFSSCHCLPALIPYFFPSFFFFSFTWSWPDLSPPSLEWNLYPWNETFFKPCEKHPRHSSWCFVKACLHVECLCSNKCKLEKKLPISSPFVMLCVSYLCFAPSSSCESSRSTFTNPACRFLPRCLGLRGCFTPPPPSLSSELCKCLTGMI